jgi:hypothetical protein
MKIVLNVVGVLLALGGLVWILQGIGVLPGSFMSNDIKWAVIGFITVLIGAGLLYYANRRMTRTKIS